MASATTWPMVRAMASCTCPPIVCNPLWSCSRCRVSSRPGEPGREGEWDVVTSWDEKRGQRGKGDGKREEGRAHDAGVSRSPRLGSGPCWRRTADLGRVGGETVPVLHEIPPFLADP